MNMPGHPRWDPALIGLDVAGLRRGTTSDAYFRNVVHVLNAMRGQPFKGEHARTLPQGVAHRDVGNLVVEAQVFNRRAPHALVCGVDVALAMLRHAAGVWERDVFVPTYDQLEVAAVPDGTLTHYGGDPEHGQTVIEIRGRYRDFALLETALLGTLTRMSRVATNVYEVLMAAAGTPVLFFPARFDLPSVQAADGYAYWVAVQRANQDSGHALRAQVSTDAGAAWFGGDGVGTVPHALIAVFLADTAAALVAFAEHMPLDVPRVALVDFNNDVIADALAVLDAYWPRYAAALDADDADGQRRWTLSGVRLDTSGNLVDVALAPDGPQGVNEALVWRVRAALDAAWQRWGVPEHHLGAAQAYCRGVGIVVSGGFDAAKIARFVAAGVPVSAFGVGSSLLRNDRASSTDFTMDVVRVRLDDTWVTMAKVGRAPGDHPALARVDWAAWDGGVA